VNKHAIEMLMIFSRKAAEARRKAVASSEMGMPQPADWKDSCDQCAHQEGRHYCLRFSRVMKNMDTLKCDQWEQRHTDQALRPDEKAGKQP